MIEIKADICVIGGGSGGLSVAAGAAQMGANVVLCEGHKMGGDCLNYGCVPSKALIEAARTMHHIHKGAAFGITAETKIDFSKIHDHIQNVIKTIEPHDSVERFESLGVQVISENARLVDNKTVQAGDHIIKAKYIVLATGSRARIFPISGLSDIHYLTNETIFHLKEQPGHLVVVGGGPIGCEIAQSYAFLGSKVTILEAAPQILGPADQACKQVILDEFKKLGINIVTNAKITHFSEENEASVKTIQYQHENDDHTIEASHILMATGRTPNIEQLGLDKAQINHTARGIEVDNRLRTNHKNIFAIGDISSSLQFTHMAGYQAGVVIQNILFKLPTKADYSSFPWVTYTTPEIAHTGLPMKDAQAQGAEILQITYTDNDRAQAGLSTNGLVKVAVGKGGKILGASIAGEIAGELITPWTIAIKNGLKVKNMASFVAPYPTLSELSKRVAGRYYTPKLYSEKTRKVVKFLLKWF